MPILREKNVSNLSFLWIKFTNAQKAIKQHKKHSHDILLIQIIPQQQFLHLFAHVNLLLFLGRQILPHFTTFNVQLLAHV